MRSPVPVGARQLTIISITALVVAYAYLIQPAWDNERAHYDLTRALAQGSPSVDESFRHPALRTIDVTRYHGRLYAAKMPGFAAASLPPYLALRAAGAETTANPTRLTWGLHLWSVIVPAVALLVLVRRRADRVAAGFGTIAAISLGAASLMLPFSTLFFSHVLSAALGFGAFAVLAHERERSSSLWLVGVSGLLVGLGCVVEYSLAIVAAALGLLALAGADRLRRALAYGLGLVLGVLPAFAFNAWAFGTPLHFPYEGWHRVGEQPLPGVFGITTPTLHNLLKIVFYPGGVGPLLLPALAGAVILWRRGRRAEAALPVLIAAAFILADSASSTPFGGVSPGPRYVIPALPFLALPLAAAYRAIPGATLGLAIAGGTFMVAATMTTALEAWDGLVAHRVVTGDFVDSVATFVGIDSRAAAIPFALAMLVAAVAAVAATPWRKTGRREVIAGGAALLGWWLIATHMTDLLKKGLAGELAALASIAVAVVVVAASYRVSAPLRPRPVRPSER
jgi:4-amino-4-deoxy-L-arabinose transferase-like glycosyltransferase